MIFSFVFELYTSESIFTAFLVAAAMFGALALYGATTKRDLTGLGPILFGALIGLIVATLVNIFVGRSTLYWITTYAGVLIFAGLTAYDMQKLTRYGQAPPRARPGAGVGPGRARALPRLHQPLPLPAADLRPAALSRKRPLRALVTAPAWV